MKATLPFCFLSFKTSGTKETIFGNFLRGGGNVEQNEDLEEDDAALDNNVGSDFPTFSFLSSTKLLRRFKLDIRIGLQ